MNFLFQEEAEEDNGEVLATTNEEKNDGDQSFFFAALSEHVHLRLNTQFLVNPTQSVRVTSVNKRREFDMKFIIDLLGNLVFEH
ncbi:hypothetical protein F8388_010198 [Cannabis sativa]|uniref:Uncharacterized protein n=1 Tax=Cannabis sativa TaxID=3483 RepID=A0A7J6GRU9_CANSA|nr:hypothetical protein G4B88_029389 [Cannabis sativa]KAF4385642.1 hypothetical protein F8388_010198 [Cannabis sativa]